MATDKKLSTLVESQLPSYLLDEGPNLVAFVKAYYEWLEQNGQATDALKNLIVNQDIDTTDLGKFYDFFRREVLSEFPENILANKKLVAKRIKDLYIAKGSRQAHRLLFRLLFNEEIDFYNPSDNILRTSDGRWTKENSIRLGAPFNGIIEELENEVVTGNRSGASAKVASVVTTFESGIEVKELFLIEVSGTFRDLETVSNADSTISGVIVNTVGPLRDVIFPDVRFTRGGAGHQPGDRVSLTSISGSGANGVVVSTSDLATTLSLISGGSGYRVSNTIITIIGGNGSGLSGIVTSVSNAEFVTFFNDTINELKDTPIGFGPTFSSNSGIVSANLAAANAFTSLGTALGTSNVAVGTINSISVVVGSYIPQSLPTVTVIDENIAKLEIPDGFGGIKGQNAVITANSIPGAITKITAENFGTRYNAADQVSVANLTRAGTTPGIGDPVISGFIENEGKYTDTKGFLSWDQKLQDNYYYQIFSYVIRSNNLGVKKYRDFVNNIVHPAGTKFFGQVDIEETFVFNDIDIESFVQIDLIGSANGVLSILSTASFGQHTLDMSLFANSALSSLAFGTSVITPAISPASILTTANVADPNVLFVINPDEINSTTIVPDNLVLNFNISANTLGFTSSIGNVTLGTFLEPGSITSTEIVSNNYSVAFVISPVSIESTITYNGDSVNFEFDIPTITSSLILSTNTLFLLQGDGTVSVSNNNVITEYLGQPVTSYLDSPIVTLGSPFAVIGTNTFFTLTVSNGSIIEIQDNNPGITGNTTYVVNTVFSNTSLSINTPYAGGGNLVSGIYRYTYLTTPPPPLSATLVLDLDASSYTGSGNWLDLTSNNNDAIAEGTPTFNAGGGSYFDFDGGATTGPGTNDSYYVPDDSVLDNMSSISFEIWLNIDTIQSTTPNVLFSKRTASTNGYIGFFSSSGYSFRAGTGTGTGIVTSTTPTTGSWQHLVVTIGNTGGSNIYINNSLVSSDAYVGNFSNIDTASSLRIGDLTDAASGVYALDGKVGLFRVYDGVLTSTDVNTRWNATKSRFGL